MPASEIHPDFSPGFVDYEEPGFSHGTNFYEPH